MHYTSWDLGNQDAGTMVQVALEGNAANVRLMDGSNFRSFHRNERHQFVGRHYKRSPVVLQVPSCGHWHLVVDYGGYAGRGRATVRILAGA